MNLARLILGKNQKAAFDTLMLQSVTVLYVHTCNGQTDIINQSGQTLRFRHILLYTF